MIFDEHSSFNYLDTLESGMEALIKDFWQVIYIRYHFIDTDIINIVTFISDLKQQFKSVSFVNLSISSFGFLDKSCRFFSDTCDSTETLPRLQTFMHFHSYHILHILL